MKCNLIDENEAQPCLWNIFCDDYHNRDVTGNNIAFKFKVRKGITSVSKKVLGSDAGTLRDFDKLSWTIMDRLIANMIVNDSERYLKLSSTIINYHDRWNGPLKCGLIKCQIVLNF